MPSKWVAEGKPEDFEAIEQAVMESERGRWFLSEYARRHKTSETMVLLNAISKLENIVAANQDMIANRLAKALGLMTPAGADAAPAAEVARHQMKFFASDEEIFEAPATPTPTAALKAVEPKPEVAKGAKLVIRRHAEIRTASGDSPVDAAQAPAEPAASRAAVAEPQAPAGQPKRRIVIIRHKAGEEINVPFQEEARASAI